MTQIILFSGLAADAEVFAAQTIAFPQLIVPDWPIPQPDEPLGSYCDRIASSIDAQEPTILGGASFGGIIALHVAKRLNPLAVVLIGSTRSPDEFPWLIRLCRPLRRLVRYLPIRFLQFCSATLEIRFFKRLFPHYSELARQFRIADPSVFKWSVTQLLAWQSVPIVQCPIFQIHGNRDFVLPMNNTKPDRIVDGGGHVISLTHSSQVNDFIESVFAQVALEKKT